MNEINFYFMPFTGSNKYITLTGHILFKAFSWPSSIGHLGTGGTVPEERLISQNNEKVGKVSISNFTLLGAGLNVTSRICLCNCSIQLNERKFIY